MTAWTALALMELVQIWWQTLTVIVMLDILERDVMLVSQEKSNLSLLIFDRNHGISKNDYNKTYVYGSRTSTKSMLVFIII